MKDTERMGNRGGEVDCGNEAYIRKGLKNQAMPRKTDQQEGDEQKEKAVHFLFFTVILESDLCPVVLCPSSFFGE